MAMSLSAIGSAIFMCLHYVPDSESDMKKVSIKTAFKNKKFCCLSKICFCVAVYMGISKANDRILQNKSAWSKYNVHFLNGSSNSDIIKHTLSSLWKIV